MHKALILNKNIDKLTKDKDIFLSYVGKAYSRDNDFPKSSFYFHKKVISMIRTAKSNGELFNSDLFLEFVYATLSTWGLDRMDGGARLVEFSAFRESVNSNLSILEELSTYKINEVGDKNMSLIKDRLSILFAHLKVMMKEIKLVGISKALHHFLPDLVLPIDRKYTLEFFYRNTNYTVKNQKEKFFAIFDKSRFIANKLHLTRNDLQKEWDTSIPKLIDNAIIGFGS
jgi:hypothetical protein